MKQGWKTMALGAPKQFQNVLDPGTSRVYTTRWLKNWTHTAKYNKRLVGTYTNLSRTAQNIWLSTHAAGKNIRLKFAGRRWYHQFFYGALTSQYPHGTNLSAVIRSWYWNWGERNRICHAGSYSVGDCGKATVVQSIIFHAESPWWWWWRWW